MEVLPKSEIPSSEPDNRQLPQTIDVMKGIGNVLFFGLTLYFMIYLICSMWPLLIGFLALYFIKKGLRFNACELMDVLLKVGIFVIDLSFNVMVKIMRFVSTF